MPTLTGFGYGTREVSCSRISASTTSRSSGVVSLMFAGSPGTTVTAWPAADTSWASSSPTRPASAASRWARASSSYANPCGVWASTMRERSRLSTRRLPSTRLTASRGAIAGKAAPDSMAAANTRRTRAAVASGRAASWTSTKSHSPSAARPVRTDSWRLSPPALTITGLRGDSAWTSRSAFSSRLGGPTTTIRSTSSRARNSSSTRARVVRPFNRTSALLPRPRREPDPAAATIAPTVGNLFSAVIVAPGSRAPAVGSRWLGKDHPSRGRLDHGGNDRGDGLVDQPPPVLNHHHRAVVEAPHALARLLAFACHGDHDLFARYRDRPHRLRELVEVQHGHPLEARDAVEVEVVGHDRPASPSGGTHQVGVDLGSLRRLVLGDLEVDRRLLLHLREDVKTATPATPARHVGRVGDQLELAQDGGEDHQRHVDETCLADVEDAAVDDDRGVEKNTCEAVALLLRRAAEE